MPRNEKAQLAPANTNRAPTQEDLEDLPPAYSMPSPSSSSIAERPADIGRLIPGLPNLNYSGYIPTGATTSNGLNTINITDSAICKSPQAMAMLISQQLALPPAPEIRIRGNHRAWGGNEDDFDIRLNMSRYFLPRDGEPGLSYSKLVAAGKGKKAPLPASGQSAIQQWAKAFCSDSTQDKCFNITRKLSNWDTDYLVGCIHALLQSLNYKGTIDVTFPVNYEKVVIRPNQTFGSALRSVFVGVEKYECEVYWPYASDEPSEDTESPHHSKRKCLVRSEMGWFKDWKPVLRAALLSRRKGWVGLDDWMEVAMRPRQPETTPSPWGEPK